MNKQKSIQENFKKITMKYTLCKFCSSRLTKKNKKQYDQCFICKNIFEKIDDIVLRISENLSSYEFSNFETGVIIKPSIIDRDDHIKSQFEIRGISSVKSNINHELSKRLAQRTNRSINYLDPDISIKVNFKDNSYEIKPKSIYLYGRYIKKSRKIRQKQHNCTNCFGKGCYTCNFYGLVNFDSVGGQISKFLIKKFDCKQVKINWIGGEEKTSLVLGNGRPFFAKIVNPKKRKKIIRSKTKLQGIELLELRKIDTLPKDQIFFKSKIDVIMKTDTPIKSRELKNLEHSAMPLILHIDGKKSATKKIYKINFKKLSTKSFKINFYADGGIPIKSLIQGSTVIPNITDLLKTKCECIQFDFKKIDVMS
mgnify:CR=1 FL=1